MEDSYRKALVWDYVMLFPLKVRDLPFDSIVAFTAKTQSGKTVGSTSMRFYYANKDTIIRERGLIHAHNFSYESIGNLIKDTLNMNQG